MFFSGCNLGCAFCQNYKISNIKNPEKNEIQADILERELFRLKNLGCHNINFVTGSHVSFELLPVMDHARKNGLDIPFVWNSSAYETVNQIQAFDQIMDVYLPDFKFCSSELSGKIANAPDYFEIAGKAITEMVRQHPKNQYIKIDTTARHDNNNNSDNCSNHSRGGNVCKDRNDNNSSIDIMKEGVLIRHLVLPGFYQDSIKILEWIEANLSNRVTLSLLSQYIPDFYESGCKDRGFERIPSLARKLTTFEYEKVVNKAISLGFTDVYIQQKESASKEYIPDF